MVEERLEEFDKRLFKIEEKMSDVGGKTRKSFEKYTEYIRALSEVIYADFTIITYVVYLFQEDSGNTSRFDFIINLMRAKREPLNKIGKLGLTPTFAIPDNNILDNLVKIAARWKLPFEKFGSYIITKLGKEQARKLVPKESLMENYGKEIIPIWEALLKE